MNLNSLKALSKSMLARARSRVLVARNKMRPLLADFTTARKTGAQDAAGGPFFLTFSRPGSMFAKGEPIMVSVYNPDCVPVEIIVRAGAPGKKMRTVATVAWKSNPVSIKLDGVEGALQIVAQEAGASRGLARRRSNSIMGQVLSDTAENAALIEANRVMEHRLDCAVHRSSTGVLTLHDPWILPGHAVSPGGGQWFATPVWEGATSLYNEGADYYADPLAYFLESIDVLTAKGFEFVTWHDVIEGRVKNSSNAILLQFDIDAGPRAMLRLAEPLSQRGIVANVMTHRRARHWYEYDVEDIGIDDFKLLQDRGWVFGYHSNSLTNLVGFKSDGATSTDLIAQAAEDMRRDVSDLREHLDIRTVTHHGGNVLNNQVPLPDDDALVCVDRPFSPDLWSAVSKSFSDGSFTARPVPLKQFVADANPGEGMYFMRCHPFKYGNYAGDHDVAPLSEAKSELPPAATLKDKIEAGESLSRLEKQAAWLSIRALTRSGDRFGYAGFEKPLSRNFSVEDELEAKIGGLRQRRRPGFLRQYPWADGDPRVLWWRVLAQYCGAGSILNVGAMPPDQKDETLAFLKPGADLIEVDIEPAREPDILADFCAADFSLDRKFQNVLLNGLPYFSDPAMAIANAARCLEPGGRLLVGAAGASHYERGGMFRPHDRPIWRRGLSEEQGQSLSLSSVLWSFDDVAVGDLMRDWQGSWDAEYLAHYWFIVAERQGNG